MGGITFRDIKNSVIEELEKFKKENTRPGKKNEGAKRAQYMIDKLKGTKEEPSEITSERELSFFLERERLVLSGRKKSMVHTRNSTADKLINKIDVLMIQVERQRQQKIAEEILQPASVSKVDRLFMQAIEGDRIREQSSKIDEAFERTLDIESETESEDSDVSEGTNRGGSESDEEDEAEFEPIKNSVINQLEGFAQKSHDKGEIRQVREMITAIKHGGVVSDERGFSAYFDISNSRGLSGYLENQKNSLEKKHEVNRGTRGGYFPSQNHQDHSSLVVKLNEILREVNKNVRSNKNKLD